MAVAMDSLGDLHMEWEEANVDSYFNQTVAERQLIEAHRVAQRNLEDLLQQWLFSHDEGRPFYLEELENIQDIFSTSRIVQDAHMDATDSEQLVVEAEAEYGVLPIGLENLLRSPANLCLGFADINDITALPKV